MRKAVVDNTEADAAAVGVSLADQPAPAADTAPTPSEALAATSQWPTSASSSYATAQSSTSATGSARCPPVPADVSVAVGVPPGEGGEGAVDPRWSGMLQPHEVKGLDYDALCIADGGKVSCVYAEAGNHPDAPNNLDAADDAADASVIDAKKRRRSRKTARLRRKPLSTSLSWRRPTIFLMRHLSPVLWFAIILGAHE